MTPRSSFLLVILAFLIATPAVHAQAWPEKPVRIIVPFPAGGNTDSQARIAADWLARRINGTFVVENRPGAGGAIAADMVAKSAADGYTLFMATLPQLAILPALGKLPYDPVRDFSLISIVGSNDFALALNDMVPAKTLSEFVAYVKERPGKLNYASAGNGSVSHLSMAMLLYRAGLQMTAVTYKGEPPALTDVLAGHIPAYFGNLAGIVPHFKAGKIKVLAVSGNKRALLLPNVPTVSEQGYPGFRTSTWNGLAAPAGTPTAIIERIAQEIGAGSKDPEFIKKLANIGIDAIGNSPAEFAEVLESDIKTWAEAVRISGAKAE